MSAIVISDLETNQELDKTAMAKLKGGLTVVQHKKGTFYWMGHFYSSYGDGWIHGQVKNISSANLF